MHKSPHQNAGNGIRETLFFKIFLGSMPLDPLEVLEQIRVAPPPPKNRKPVYLEYTERLETSDWILIRTNYIHKLTHKNIHT